MERMSISKSAFIAFSFLLVIGAAYLVTSEPAAPKQEAAPIVATFFCTIGGKFQATFATSSVALLLSDGRAFSLPQTMSGSGVRYEATTTGADIVFWNKGDNAFITENDTATYEDCTAARVAPAETAGNETYTDQSKSFTFTLPTDFSIAGSAMGYSQDWWSVDATTTGIVLAHVTVPKEYMPGTNFGDAWFTVGTSADLSAVAECLTNPKGNFGSTTPVTINGASFTKIAFTGAAAGNRYDTTSYRTVRNNQCYAVEYTIHYGVIENYPVGAVKEFDEARVQSALEKMVQSFRFLQ